MSALQTAEAFRATHIPDGRQWASGDAVVVSGGAACGMRGAIVKVDRERAVVLLQMFGAFREVDLPLRYLQPVVGGLKSSFAKEIVRDTRSTNRILTPAAI